MKDIGSIFQPTGQVLEAFIVNPLGKPHQLADGRPIRHHQQQSALVSYLVGLPGGIGGATSIHDDAGAKLAHKAPCKGTKVS